MIFSKKKNEQAETEHFTGRRGGREGEGVPWHASFLSLAAVSFFSS
jgi:hypothetical protein